MFVVIVDFEIHPQHWPAFLPRMRENARASRELESGCRQFDVCTDPAKPNTVFPYEVYDDRAAFEAHLASAHFNSFDAEVGEMIIHKAVRTLERAAS